MENSTRIRRLSIVNVFIVDENDGLTIVDTAIRGSHKSILRHAALAGKPIERILLTHAHDDHVGALDALAAAVPDAQVIATARDARLMAGDLSLDADEPQTKLRGGLSGTDTVPTRLVGDGEHVGSLRVIATPGHTPGHIALLDERDGTLFCGDVFSTLGGMATTAQVNPLFPLPAMATWHRPTVIESAKILLELAPERLAPGHGRVIEHPVPDMRTMIAKAEKKLSGT
ncbi:MAG: MBL fold metallo-hydrolase [Solirubrobacterales bacterium]